MGIKSGAVAIVGVGESDLGRVPGKSAMALSAQAAHAALADAGLTKDEVEGLFALNFYMDYYVRHTVALAEYLGLSSARTRFVETVSHGSASSSGQMVHLAAAAILGGLCETALLVGADSFLSFVDRDRAIAAMAQNRDKEFENPYGPFIPATFGVAARRYLHETGARPELLAHVPVTARKYACLNPRAQMYGQPLTVEDVLSSRMIADPFHKLECAIVSDGGCALVMTTLERARQMRKRPILVLAAESSYGSGEGLVHDSLSQSPNLLMHRYGSRASSRRAFAAAGVSKDDIDVLFTYDPFPIIPILFLEGLGYCADGEGAEFFASGRLDPGGPQPWNPHGGLLSYCHPGNPGGLFMFVEAVRQLRGEALGYQAPDPELAIIQGYGAQMGIFPTTILGRG